MAENPPEGYRYPTVDDDLWQLNAEHALTSQCKCGHLEADHFVSSRCGRCSKCDCKRYTWIHWLVQIASEPSPKP